MWLKPNIFSEKARPLLPSSSIAACITDNVMRDRAKNTPAIKHSHNDKDNGHGAVHVEDRQAFRHHNGKEIKQQHEAPHEEQKETDGVHCLTAHLSLRTNWMGKFAGMYRNTLERSPCWL